VEIVCNCADVRCMWKRLVRVWRMQELPDVLLIASYNSSWFLFIADTNMLFTDVIGNKNIEIHSILSFFLCYMHTYQTENYANKNYVDHKEIFVTLYWFYYCELFFFFFFLEFWCHIWAFCKIWDFCGHRWNLPSNFYVAYTAINCFSPNRM
jgi:hypothetical protein